MRKRSSRKPGNKKQSGTGGKKSIPRTSLAPNEKLIGRAIIGSGAPKRRRR